MSIRSRGLVWALVCSPLLGWTAAYSGDRLTHGRLGVWGAVVLLAILPAALASAGNAALGRDRGAVVRAGILGASVCYSGLILLAVVFFLTVPPEFFT